MVRLGGGLDREGNLDPEVRERALACLSRFGQRLRGLPKSEHRGRTKRMVELCGLGDVTHKDIGELSKGYRQRVGIAQAILHRPDAVILDEPTAGLDPLQTQQIRGLLQQLSAKRSLILSTHLLDDVQLLCSSVILIDNGRKTAQHAVTAGTDLLAHFRQHANADLLGAGT